MQDNLKARAGRAVGAVCAAPLISRCGRLRSARACTPAHEPISEQTLPHAHCGSLPCALQVAIPAANGKGRATLALDFGRFVIESGEHAWDGR